VYTHTHTHTAHMGYSGVSTGVGMRHLEGPKNPDGLISAYFYSYMCTKYIFVCTARSVKDKTRNGHRNAKRNPDRNQETIILDLFSFENLKKDLEQ